jgi:hypothetical protein
MWVEKAVGQTMGPGSPARCGGAKSAVRIDTSPPKIEAKR